MQRIVMAGVLASLMASTANAAEPGVDFFEKKIRPILVEHCYKCHSAGEKQRGGLVVDTRVGLLKGGDNGPSVVPGKPDASLLIEAVRYQDEFLRMPPKGKLPEAAVADLEKWVAMGAPDPRDGTTTTTAKTIDVEKAREFWAYRPIRKPALPEVQDTAWASNDVDRFILAALEKKGLRPGADADRLTLLRRATFALTGLPPTPEQIETFARDDSPGAYANLIDRLLDSPAFGERWGRHWLDVARFSESTGGGRSMLLPDAWRYRDYVVRSFNQDKPYDRFVMEQLAGDLMEASSPEEKADNLTGTAFLALGPTNYERQDKAILEMDVIDEQLDTMGRAFLAMTIGCARCHDHKFDPIPTKDYYALAGIFHSTQTMVHDNVSKWVELSLPMEPELAAQVTKHESAVAALQEKIKSAKAALKKAGKDPLSRTAVALDDLPGIVVDDEQAKRVGEWKQSTHTSSYIHKGYLHDENTGKGSKTLTFAPKFTRAGRYEVLLAYTEGTNRATRVPVTVFSADGEKVVHVNQKVKPPVDGHFVSLGVYQFETTDQWFVMVSNEETDGHVIADAVQFIPEDGADAKPALAKKPAAAAPAVDMTEAELKRLEAQLKKLQAGAPKRPVTMAVREGKPHDIAVCIRGNFHSQGEITPRGFLQIATPGKPLTIPTDQSGRLQLAQWLASGDNPLTARVMANRIWHHLVGVGIVRTVDNFGVTGELPSHPELLDYLASRFIEEGWSVKKLIREIVLSHTYRLSSDPHPQARKVDPENRLLARMNRKRLEAEAIRDSILAVSGQLTPEMGGPNIRPGTNSEYAYKFDDVRRSIYTPIFRNQLHDLFEVFDFADPNLVVGRRNVSTVSTQALFLLNSPFVMDQARVAAERTLSWKDLDHAGRIERAYLLALGRSPTPREYDLVVRYLSTPSADTPEGQLAAWEKVYQVLYACLDFRYVR